MDYSRESLDELLKIIADKKKQLDALRPLPAPLVKNLQQWFAVELTYTSNALEGNTLTRNETALVVEKGITIAGKPLKDHVEAVNYTIALNFVNDLVDKKRTEISLNDILDIHRIILKSIDDEHAGVWRKIAVKIAGSNVVLPDPIKVPDLMTDFIHWLHDVNDAPVIVAAEAHRRLLAIHPFVDGNGRTARLLMNLLLMQTVYHPAIISMEERKAYLEALEKSDKTNDCQDFYRLIAKSVGHSLDIYLDAAHKTI